MIRIVFVFVLALLIFHLAADCLARRLTGRQHGANGCGLYLPASRLGLGPALCQRLPAALTCLAGHPLSSPPSRLASNAPHREGERGNDAKASTDDEAEKEVHRGRLGGGDGGTGQLGLRAGGMWPHHEDRRRTPPFRPTKTPSQ